MQDFRLMSGDELDVFVVAHRDELEAQGIEPGEIAAALASGQAVAETREFGFAVVQRREHAPHLWLLYVDDSSRGRGTGRRFVRELVRTHAAEWHMTLLCHGARRRAFFGRAGFRVESRDGEWRTMTTNDAPHGTLAR